MFRERQNHFHYVRFTSLDFKGSEIFFLHHCPARGTVNPNISLLKHQMQVHHPIHACIYGDRSDFGPSLSFNGDADALTDLYFFSLKINSIPNEPSD